MDYGVLVDPILKPDELIHLAQKIENLGFTHFWYPDEKFFRECYIGLTMVAAHTDTIVLGPCVTDPYSRHPIMTATAIGTLAEYASDRVWLGLGAGGRGLASMGIERIRPARALREAIDIIRNLLAGKTVDYQGEVIQLRQRPLDFSPPQKVPMMIGTGHGHYIQQLAGEIADAAMLANYASPQTINGALERIKTGAGRIGRTLSDIYLISRVDVGIHVNGKRARAAVAPKILSALRASYPSLNCLEDLPPFELSSDLLIILSKKDYNTKTRYAKPEHSAPLIPDPLIDHLAVAGTPQQVTAQLKRIAEIGFDQITIRPVPTEDQSLDDCLDLFSQTVIPQLG